VIDPGVFRAPKAFQDDMADLLGRMRGNVPVDPAQPVLIPGTGACGGRTPAPRRQSLAPALLEEIRAVCTESGAAFILAA
jgi:LDH2 family malate/lactate/ureidoglycolate dehydrogenase